MRAVAVIPARMAATRFPGKPLASICGLPMIEHVRRRVALSKGLAATVVATCDEEIRDVVESFGGQCVMTADTHERCTDRVAEAVTELNRHQDVPFDVVVNVQGDEPLVQPAMIERALAPMDSQDVVCANLLVPIRDDREFEDPNCVKTVIDQRGRVLYFSREPIPSMAKSQPGERVARYKQLGIISFRTEFLNTFASLAETPLERTESVDMMRVLEHGHAIHAVAVEGPMIGVDLPDHVSWAEKALKGDPLTSRYLTNPEAT